MLVYFPKPAKYWKSWYFLHLHHSYPFAIRFLLRPTTNKTIVIRAIVSTCKSHCMNQMGFFEDENLFTSISGYLYSKKPFEI